MAYIHGLAATLPACAYLGQCETEDLDAVLLPQRQLQQPLVHHIPLPRLFITQEML